ncbi:hypothetical protein [Spirillospora sp. NBC_01491]|uniref:hypothetical protein n=1 Tax=Spirillospora sp. NBC_01491 TaxID=2976007 RepID=UPI002E368B97|nr:hypothetical protein [Spirillospora sp. NBC_01491]
MAELMAGTSPPMVVLRPGDRVLIALTEDAPPEELQEFTAQLRRSFPTVSFTVIGGIAGLGVQAGGDSG